MTANSLRLPSLPTTAEGHREAMALFDEALIALQHDRFDQAFRLIDQACHIDFWMMDLHLVGTHFAHEPPEMMRDIALGLYAAGCSYPAISDLLAFSATQLGNYDEVRHILDYKNLLHVDHLAPFDDAEREQLIIELVGEPTIYGNDGTRSAHYMLQRHGLSEDTPELPMTRLAFSRLRKFVDSYLQRIAGLDPNLPFIARRPEKYRLSGWSVISGRDSFHTPHYHFNAWASGVYFISVPDFVARSPEQAGWYRTGRCSPRRQVTAAQGWEQHWVTPENDLVLIGPGHFFHDTIPLGRDDALRIAIAFNVKPPHLPGQRKQADG